jgi:CHASE2 domain-containing sensor protein
MKTGQAAWKNPVNSVYDNGRKRFRPMVVLSVLASILTLLTLLIGNSALVKDWENRSQTVHYRLQSWLRAPEWSPLPIVLILIDDAALPDDARRSPLDRNLLAELIDRTSVQRPALIALNVLLDRSTGVDEDQRLARALSTAGNVVIRDDPYYPAIPLLADAALDHGVMSFRADSSGTVQEICDSAATCRSESMLHRVMMQHYHRRTQDKALETISPVPWRKIRYEAVTTNKTTRYPILSVADIRNLPPEALTGKLVLIGAGFPDLYPRLRTPLSDEGQFKHETEVLAEVLTMFSSGRFLVPVPPLAVGLSLGVILIAIGGSFRYRGILAGLATTLLCLTGWTLVSGFVFVWCDRTLPLVWPVGVIIFYWTAGLTVMSLHAVLSRYQVEIRLKQAKIDFLTNELHTHALFNELSRLSLMIRQDPTAAREYLVEFADMLRTSLKYGDRQWVPVMVEWEYLTAYLQQQRLIHRERIVFETELAGAWTAAHIPWQACFPLVENAVKYTEAYRRQYPELTPRVMVRMTRQADRLQLTVSNPYKTDLSVASSRTGLKNLKERLSWCYPKGDYSLSSAPTADTWITQLDLPLVFEEPTG